MRHQGSTMDKQVEKLKELVALKLWEWQAIKINFETPFKLASGKLSPIYINCRMMISDPDFIELFLLYGNILLKNVEYDLVAGGETAGIPFAAFFAYKHKKTLIYVRKKTKDYGTQDLVEGVLEKGARVLLIEDLITDGGSKKHFIKAIRQTGGHINTLLVIFDRKQGGQEALKKINVDLYSLTDLDYLLFVGSENNIIKKEHISKIKEYLKESSQKIV